MEGNESVKLGARLVAGRYIIESKLGQGGMGDVYLARDENLRRRVALKVLRAGFLEDATAAARFRREARAASQVQHPNVVAIYDFGAAEDGHLYLAMEYVPGPTLAGVLGASGPLPLLRALRILYQTASAVHAAHTASVLHRDLKPGNIVLVEEQELVKVLDFGLAKMLGPAATVGLTVAGKVVGTPEYIAPERCLDRPGDERSDLYSLGIIAFELLTGRAPFAGRVIEMLRAHIERQPPPPSFAAGRDDVPAELDALVLRLLAKRPEDRPHSAGEVVAVLESLLPTGEIALRASRPMPTQPQASPNDTLPLETPTSSEGLAPASTLAPLPTALAWLGLAWTLRMRGFGTVPLTDAAASLAWAVSRLVDAQLALDKIAPEESDQREPLEQTWLAGLALVEAGAAKLKTLLEHDDLKDERQALEGDPLLGALLRSAR